MTDLKPLKRLTDEQPKDTGGDVVVNMPKRRPGRPKGSMKQPGSGRKPGTPNHTTQALRKRIHRLGKPVETVCGVAAGKTTIEGFAQADAIKLLFKAVVPELRAEIVSGPDDGPIETRATQILEASQRVSEAFTEVANTPDPGEILSDESLGAVQSVNFLLAQREAAERAQNPLRTSTPPAVDAAPEPSSPPEEPTSDAEAPVGEPEAPPEGHILAFVETDFHIVGCPPARPNLPPIYELRNARGLVRRASYPAVFELLRRQMGGSLGRWMLQEPVQVARKVMRSDGDG